jgi:dTDP-L-rhamnose 4-epimerase
MKQVLITGGAGFIGSHLADLLLAHGWRVRAFDSMSDQVHGAEQLRPDYLAREVELVTGDVRDGESLRRALKGVDAVVHLAARVGVGQSMYRVEDYVGVNDLGCAALLQALVERPVERLVVASSMSIYGEGLYRTADGADAEAAPRSPEMLRRGQWDPLDASGRPLAPAPTPESKRPDLASVYALTKYAQERMCLLVGQAYGIATTALRLFNVYGPRQALSNPYTGVLAIFASRLMNGKPPVIFEDGRQRRDFVHVRDVARAFMLALERPQAAGRVFNVGSGRSLSVLEVAERLAEALDRGALAPEITRRLRIGDVRHCFADVSLAADVLGFRAEVDFDDGMAELAEWLAGRIATDHVERATGELTARGLVA